MHTNAATRAEADIWIAVLTKYGHLHRVEPGPDGVWTVQRTVTSTPRTLHHPALVLDFVAEVLHDVGRDARGLPR